MVLSIILLLVFIFIAWKLSPRERKEDAHIHGAGQIGLLAAVALFGVDYFTSFYYGAGEMMSALHPYGLQEYAYIAVGVIALANFVFGALYMYSLGPFNEGGGSYTASMRYLKPTLSLIVAVTLLEDYVLTIVVSALSGSDQLLSVLGAYNTNWVWHFLIGASLGRRDLVPDHPRARRIVTHRVHRPGYLRDDDDHDGDWSGHRALQRRARRAPRGSASGSADQWAPRSCTC